jgi:signal transduction histidine kinase
MRLRSSVVIRCLLDSLKSRLRYVPYPIRLASSGYKRKAFAYEMLRKSVSLNAGYRPTSAMAGAKRSVLVAVEDSGPGLDPAIAQRIFEPFFTTKPEGLGMGLSICRSIIEAHGGQLWVSPREPHGTAFRFTVPTGVTT